MIPVMNNMCVSEHGADSPVLSRISPVNGICSVVSSLDFAAKLPDPQ
jgi:hypothetical protein